MLLCKCQIQIGIRNTTNKGIATLYQHINDSLLMFKLEDVHWPNRPTFNCPNNIIQTRLQTQNCISCHDNHMFI